MHAVFIFKFVKNAITTQNDEVMSHLVNFEEADVWVSNYDFRVA